MPPFDNYYCFATGCGYRTKANSAEEAEKQVVKDGGVAEKKKTVGPRCGGNSLQFLYPTNL